MILLQIQILHFFQENHDVDFLLQIDEKWIDSLCEIITYPENLLNIL